MAQNYPSMPQNGQPVSGFPGGLPSLSQLGQPQTVQQQLAALQALQNMGQDPRLMAQAQQMLQNPNAGDGFLQALQAQGQQNAAGAPQEAGAPQPFENPLMPGTPQELLAGGVLGAGLGLGLSHLQDKGHMIKLAKRLDNTAGFRQISAFLENNVSSRFQGKAWVDALRMRAALGHDTSEAAVKAALEAMEKQQIGSVLKPFQQPSRFARLKSALGFNIAQHQTPEYVAKLAGKTNFEDFISTAKHEIERLKSLATKTKADKHAINTLTGLSKQINGLSMTFKPLTAETASMLHQLEKQSVGPVGRAFASGMLYTKRNFCADAMTDMLGKKSTEVVKKSGIKQLAGKMLAPFLGGMMAFGSAFAMARKAEEGEKSRTFFHELFGNGIGTFIGIDIGRRLLNSIEARGVLGRLAALRPLRWIPLLGRLSAGGLMVELTSMIVFGGIAQKVFAGISDKIFGKPSDKSLGKQKPAQALPSSPTGQALTRSTGLQERFNRATTGNATQPTTPRTFSLSPDEIMQSAAASRDIAEQNSIIGNGAWNSNNLLDPMGH